MSQTAYVSSLKSQHEALDRAILQEEQRPAPDDLVLNAMKRRKLRLKDLLQEMSAPAH
jgi:hypothetical protein